MRLYHFTALMHLPAILREGLRIGMVPINPTVSVAQINAPNLTTNPDPAAQSCWCGGGIVNKTKIRMTVEVPDDKLTSFRQIMQKYKMRNSWVKLLDPYYERPHWYFAFDGVPVEHITKIEILEGRAYRELPSDELQALSARIDREREDTFRVTTVKSGRQAGYERLDFKDGRHASWLLDGEMQVMPSRLACA